MTSGSQSVRKEVVGDWLDGQKKNADVMFSSDFVNKMETRKSRTLFGSRETGMSKT